MDDHPDKYAGVSGGYADEAAPARPEPERSPLFRAEALAAQNELRWGRPVAIMPVSWTVLLVFLVVIVAAAAAFLSVAELSRKETVRGLLRAAGGEARVVAQQGGVLRDLRVGEGATVTRGQVLGVVSTARNSANGDDSARTVLASLLLEEQSLRARLESFDAARPLAAASAQSDVTALAAEREAARAAIALGGERRKLAEERVAAGRALAEKGLIAVEELRRRQEAIFAVDQAIADARAREAILTARIAQARSQLAKQPLDANVSRGALEEQLTTIAQRRAQAEAAVGYELRAPIDGRVTALQAFAGQTVDSAHPLMTITPDGSRLSAEIYVPSRAIGFVERGQRVRLLYDAFPYQRFGPAYGVVESVSATVLLPNEVQAAVPVDEPVYRVIVRLERGYMRAFDRAMPLSSGMALTADIILEKRSFAAWLFEPLAAMRGRM